jgi:hypothetical protein
MYESTHGATKQELEDVKSQLAEITAERDRLQKKCANLSRFA